MKFIGQDELISKLNSFTLDTLPNTCMIEGPNGSGKHTIVNMLSEKFNLELIDITENLNLDYITELLLKSTPYMYIIDGNMLNIKNENVILKLLEEPLKNTFIFILINDKNTLIDTIKNRCYNIKIPPYSKQTLETFLKSDNEDNDLILSLAKTPGDILSMQSQPLKNIVDLCVKIFDKINMANYANILSLSNQIAFKNEKDKFNFDVFIETILNVSRDRMLTNNNYYEYFTTNDFYNKSKVKNVDKKQLFDNYLINLKQQSMQYGVNNT